MKHLFFLITISLLSFGCSASFDLENPNVKQFVYQLKNGTYNKYHLGEDGKKLWTNFPEFNKDDIPLFIEMAKDTTFVNPFGHFPVNPISSIPPYRTDENGQMKGIMLGEYLLWCVETIINEGEFPSLTPLLRENDNPLYTGFSGKDILAVREKYLNWWNEYGKNGDLSVSPLYLCHMT